MQKAYAVFFYRVSCSVLGVGDVFFQLFVGSYGFWCSL